MDFPDGTEHLSVRRKAVNPKEEFNPDAVQHLILENPRMLGKGNLSANGVFQVDARFSGDPKERIIPMVVKPYTYWEEGMLERIMERYRAAREAKLKVPGTLRFDPNRHMTVMADFNGESHIALSCNNPSYLVEEKSLKEIPDFERIMDLLVAEAEKAANKGFCIDQDSYFILLPAKEGVQSDFMIGDLDNFKMIGDENIGFYPDNFEVANLLKANLFLERFCNRWLEPSLVADYQARREKRMGPAIDAAEAAWEQKRRPSQ